MRLARQIALVLVMGTLLLLSACKEQLYSGIVERDANDMLALLLRNGISASKELDKDGLATISVESFQLVDAVDILRTHGFPREEFDTVGKVFQKQGLVSSPTEDHIRLVYALSQELNDTLSRIDGVLSARVHVVLPQPGPSGSIPAPSSAAVFVRYQESVDIAQHVPQIKTLVSNSIEDLTYDLVSVALFPIQVTIPQQAALGLDYARVAYLSVAPASREPLLITLAALAGLVVLLVLGNIVTYAVMRRRAAPARRERAA